MDIQYMPNTAEYRNKVQQTEQSSVAAPAPEKERAVIVKKASKKDVLKDDISKMWNYVTHSVLLPALKNTISSAVSNGLDMLLFGEIKSRRTADDSSFTRSKIVDYNNVSRRNSTVVENRRSPDINYRDIEIPNQYDGAGNKYNDAFEIEREVRDRFAAQGRISMSEYFNIIGGSMRQYADYTKQSVGWYDLSKFYVVENRDRNSCSLIMPTAIVL